ncbi:MAG: hypothetical protein FJY74_03210 [Candidatus Eisenbacteria bacterium]|nr:hypothetical protein [Candidatus Eisenbacteria bacterium]
MARTLAGVLAGLMVLGLAGMAGAGIPDPDLSTVVLSAGGLLTCPQLDGPPYQYITVTALRADATPIVGIPWSSFFFFVTGGYNVNITNVDAETGVTGQIRFQVDDAQAIPYPGPVTITCQIYTVVLNDSDNLTCATVDLFPLGAPDGTVGVQDFVIFGQDFNQVAPRSDFNFSGGPVGVQDFVIFGQHFNHHN